MFLELFFAGPFVPNVQEFARFARCESGTDSLSE